jgi:Ca-activated chloride channel family protein
MFRFEHSDYLLALFILPLFLALYAWGRFRQKQALRRFGNPNLLNRLMPSRSTNKPVIKMLLFLIGLLLLIAGLANPQWGSKAQAVKRKSIDIYIALDISQSMWAEDIAPNRLTQAQRLALQMVETLRGNRLGLIIFAGNAYLQVPLTTDYAAISLMIKSTQPDMIPLQGTAIGEAISIANRKTKEADSGNRVLILLSDGENHIPGAEDMARKAKSKGMRIYTIGVGSKEGSFVPYIFEGERAYKRDESGNPVVSKIDEGMLRRVARNGGGDYYRLNNNNDEIIDDLAVNLDKLEKREREQRIFKEYQSHFQIFIGLAIVFLLFDFLIGYPKRTTGFWGKNLLDIQ